MTRPSSTMKALYLPSHHFGSHSALEVDRSTAPDLHISRFHPPPEFPILQQEDLGKAEDGDDSESAATAHKEDDSHTGNGKGMSIQPSSSRTSHAHQYLLQVIATSTTQGELARINTQLSACSTTRPTCIPCHEVVGRIVRIRSRSKISSTRVTFIRAPMGLPEYKLGDTVRGFVDLSRNGAAAEQVVALEHELCKVPSPPSDMSVVSTWHEKLVAIPLAALTA